MINATRSRRGRSPVLWGHPTALCLEIVVILCGNVMVLSLYAVSCIAAKATWCLFFLVSFFFLFPF